MAPLSNNSKLVTNNLDERSGENWLGTKGPLDFSLWCYLKKNVYACPPPSFEILENGMKDCIDRISKQHLIIQTSSSYLRIFLQIYVILEKIVVTAILNRHSEQCYIVEKRIPYSEKRILSKGLAQFTLFYSKCLTQVYFCLKKY